MASVSWTASTGGSWDAGANWSTGTAPMTGDGVTINTGSTSIIVTYSTGSLSLDSLNTGAADLLDVTGGTLATEGNGYNMQGGLLVSGGTLRLVGSSGGGQGSSVAGTISQSGGTIAFVNDATIANGVLNQSAGVISIAHGVLTDQDSAGTLNGTISGAGELDFNNNNNGTTILGSHCVLSTGGLAIDQGTLFLQERLTYANRFSLRGTLDLNGNAVSLSGHDALDGDVNGGTLTLSGTGHLNGLTLENGAYLNVTSSINETGNIQLGGNTGTGTLGIASGGTLRITGNDSISQGNSAGLLINKGTLIKTAGGSIAGATTISDALNSTGTIEAMVGTIDLSGPGSGVASTITGTLAGGGSIDFANGSYTLGGGAGLTLAVHRLEFSGNTNSTNVTIASALSYGGNWEQSGGLLLFENNLNLTGTSAFQGGELKGTATITDSGALALGNSMQLEGNLTFLLNGNVDQSGQVNFGDISDSVDRATLSATSTWAMEGNSSINGNFGTITNLGTFAKTNGGGNDTVSSVVLNTGTMLVDSGTLSLSGQGTLGGTVGGPGVLDLSGQFTLASGLALGVGELILDSQGNDIQATLAGNLTYANQYAQEGGTLALNSDTLTLNGTTSLDSGAIIGGGSLLVNGNAVINNFALSQGGLLQFNGSTEQIGNVTLTGGSTAPTLSVGAGGVYTIDNGLSIGGPGGSVIGTVSVAGTLVAAGSNTSTIAATVQDSGTIAISHGQMQFLGPLMGNGKITLFAGGAVDLMNASQTSLGVTFGAGGGLLTLQTPDDYSGTIGGFASGDAIELNGFAFSSTITPTISGNTVTITEPMSGPSVTLTFSTAQSQGSLELAVGPHGGLALIHI